MTKIVSSASWWSSVGGLVQWLCIPLILIAAATPTACVHAFHVGIRPSRKSYPRHDLSKNEAWGQRRALNAAFQLSATKGNLLDDGSEGAQISSEDHNDGGGNKTSSHLANDANLSSVTKNNPTWDQNIAALLEYNETYGTVNLPSNSKYYPNLGQWVKNLRNMKGRLAEEQVQQLEDIGFLWNVEAKMEKDDRQWYEMFIRLKAYKQGYGHCRVPNKYKPDKQLGLWVMNQRRLYTDNNIREDRKDRLDSIGFVWRLRPFTRNSRPDQEELWEQRYQELIEFKEEHNHTNVPRDYPPNKELAYWVNSQRIRNQDGTMLEGRKPRLDEIGFIWEFEPIWDESWLEQYEELKTHLQELAIYKEIMERNPEGSKDATRPVPGEKIRVWAVQQRTSNARGDMDPERKDMLDEIGFEWWE